MTDVHKCGLHRLNCALNIATTLPNIRVVGVEMLILKERCLAGGV